ncbi:MAG: hypothetical protein ACOC06_07785 [Halorubrum sp.]
MTGDATLDLDEATSADDETERDEEEAGHLDDIEDGAGCTEIWERLSERREE